MNDCKLLLAIFCDIVIVNDFVYVERKSSDIPTATRLDARSRHAI